MQAFGFLAVDGHQILGIVGGVCRVESDQLGTLRGLPDDAVGCAGQFFERVRSLILHDELKAAELAESLNRRRQRREDYSALNPKQLWSNAVHNRCRGVLIAFALRVGLERDEDQSLICCRSCKTETGNRKRPLRFGHARKQVGNLLSDCCGISQRGSRWRLDHNDEVSLVLVRYETGRNPCEYEVSQAEAGKEESRHRQLVAQKVMQQSLVPARNERDAIVKLSQPPPLLSVGARKKDCRQCRGQSERVEG